MKINWLTFRIPVGFILYLYSHRLSQNYALKIANELGTPYSHIVNLTKEFEKRGLITKFPINDRTKNLKLTDKGKIIAKNLIEIKGV